jgi:hypothetical protein
MLRACDIPLKLLIWLPLFLVVDVYVSRDNFFATNLQLLDVCDAQPMTQIHFKATF